MRSLVVVAVVLGVAHPAHADGFHFGAAIGGAGFRGGLRAYGSGAVRVQMDAGYRRGDWTVAVAGGMLVDDDAFAIDCYPETEQCGEDPDVGEYSFVGLDVKKRWPVVRTRWNGLGVRFALHAGPRYVWGLGALTGYEGVGVNAGAAIEGDIWVLGYYLDFGMDALVMSIPVDAVSGTAPYFVVGARYGWL